MFPADMRLVTLIHDPNIQTDVKNDFFFCVVAFISTFDFATAIEVHIV